MVMSEYLSVRVANRQVFRFHRCVDGFDCTACAQLTLCEPSGLSLEAPRTQAVEQVIVSDA